MHLFAALMVLNLQLAKLVLDRHAVEGRVVLHLMTHWLERVIVRWFEIHRTWGSLHATGIVAAYLIKHGHVVLGVSYP